MSIQVNNAGQSGVNTLSQRSPEKWHEIMATNVDGTYYCSQRALEEMPDGGRVINISSVLGKFGVPGYTAYCTSKHAIIGFTRALALEVTPRKITVNAICPGWVETDMAHSGMEEGAATSRLTYEQFRRKALAQVPLQEIIQPEEVAALACFLISSAAHNITGQALNICGGRVSY